MLTLITFSYICTTHELNALNLSPTLWTLLECQVSSLKVLNQLEMGRGVSAGGGQRSMGYLFGSGETTAASNIQRASSQGQPANGGYALSDALAASPPIEKQILARIPGILTNNYLHVKGQNCGNFLTVHLWIALSGWISSCLTLAAEVASSLRSGDIGSKLHCFQKNLLW